MTQSPLHKLSPKDELEDSSLLRSLIDSLPEQVYVKDLEGCYVLNNIAHVRALGAQSPEEVAGKSDSEFYPKELAERYRADEQEVINSGRPLVDREEPGVDEEGTKRWHSTTKVPLRDGSGEIVGLVGITRDVTERKEAEEKLKKSEARLAEAQRITRLGNWEWEVKTGEVYWSDETFRIYGFTPQEFVPTLGRLMEAVHPDDEELVRKNIDEAFYEGKPYDFEHRIVRPDGEERIVHRQAEVVFDEEGEPLRMIGTVHDVTERKEAEKALKESEERYRAVVEHSMEGIYLFDPDTKEVLECNTALQEMLGYTAEELQEMTIYDFIAHDKEDIDQHVRRSLREERRHKGERKYRRKDGSVIDVDANATVISYGGRDVVCNVVRDITERKEAEEKLKESEERFRSLTDATFEAIAIIERGRILEVNRAYTAMFGYEPSEIVGKPAWEAVAPESVELVRRNISSGYEEPYEAVMLKKDGTTFDAEVRGRMTSYRGRTVRVTAIRDITERKRAEEKLKESEERFRTAFEDAPVGVALVDLDGRRFRVNRALCEMLGYSEEELLGRDYLEHVHPDDHEISAEHIRRALEEGEETYILERRYIQADGHVVWNLSSVSLIRDSKGNPSHFVCLHQDITGRKELEERLEHQAFHDSLTGLPNRALFLDRLEHALARARREGGPVAVLLVDLNEFKRVNDTLGHDAGNAVLIGVAERLRDSVRPGDTVGRIFGDEFVMLLEAPAGKEEAKRVTERIHEALQSPFDVDGHEVFVSPSVGIALGESEEDEPKEVLRHADLAMYEAKSRGKTRYEVYNPNMDTWAQERMGLEKDLRQAIEREEFVVHYQPKVLLETGEIVGIEALVRWQHPDRGLLLPTRFIPYAEETGLIDRIGLWVLKESCRQMREWQERYSAKLGSPLDLCVNLSAREIQQPDLTEKVTAVLRETGLDPRRLTLEISERTAMKDAEYTLGKLRELKDLGIELALDDFGTGYCSLVYLEHSVFDFLKIDRLLVHREREDLEGSATMISAMVNMAHSLGLAVIVEGVETEEQLAKLKEMGCEMAQGHYFAKPLPGEALEGLLQDSISQ